MTSASPESPALTSFRYTPRPLPQRKLPPIGSSSHAGNTNEPHTMNNSTIRPHMQSGGPPGIQTKGTTSGTYTMNNSTVSRQTQNGGPQETKTCDHPPKVLTTLRKYTGLIVAVAFVVVIIVVTATVAGIFAAKPDDTDKIKLGPPRRENPELLFRQPYFLATVELRQPAWSSNLADVNNEEFRRLASEMESTIDGIFYDSDIWGHYKYDVVTGFNETSEHGVLQTMDLHVRNESDLTEENIWEAFHDGISKHLQTKRNRELLNIKPKSLKVKGRKPPLPTTPTTTTTITTTSTTTITTTSTTTLRAPSNISETMCGTARLYSWPTGQSGRIIGGTPTEWYGVYPWIVMLLNNGRHICGGTIWDKQHILTAAHCIVGLPHLDNHTILVNSSQLEIIAGKWRYGVDSDWRFSQRVQVVAARMHKDYDASTYNNDIAVLKLNESLQSNEVVEPVCHPDNDEQLPAVGIVAGWGTTREGVYAPPTTLTAVNLSLYDRHDCSRLFKSWFDNGDIDRFLHNGTICAAPGLRGGADACQGDSGGPLFAYGTGKNYTILGVVSNGYGCGRVGDPGFYTFVPYYLDWIAETINTILRPL